MAVFAACGDAVADSTSSRIEHTVRFCAPIAIHSTLTSRLCQSHILKNKSCKYDLSIDGHARLQNGKDVKSVAPEQALNRGDKLHHFLRASIISKTLLRFVMTQTQ